MPSGGGVHSSEYGRNSSVSHNRQRVTLRKPARHRLPSGTFVGPLATLVSRAGLPSFQFKFRKTRMANSSDSTTLGDGELVTASTEAELTFTVDSRLLEELGERLVGKPSMALAELVKNAYDADAETVHITVDRSNYSRILIEDNGHGMTAEEFGRYWMRVGSQHKRDQKRSRKFLRSFTGSKGVGRIATQMLSKSLRLISVAEATPTRRLLAHLKWATAINTGDLVNVVVGIREEELRYPQDHGTTIILEGLQHEWSEDAIRDLAREIWQLQSPFGRLVADAEETGGDFEVRLSGGEESLEAAFRDHMAGILGLWTARVVGEVREGESAMSLQFRGEEPIKFPPGYNKISVDQAHFELRFYELLGRQPRGIRVKDARDYLKQFGGVHIYDTGFRLPFYGEKDNDWLLISYDMSRRLTLSELLSPDIKQVRRMMLSLPQWNQVLGALEINTATEPGLEVTITRDRLVDTSAFRELRDLVRQAVHWYANEKVRGRLADALAVGTPPVAIRSVAFHEALDRARPHLPVKVAKDLEDAYTDGVVASESVVDKAETEASALGAFATAGIAAVGYQHELRRQFILLAGVADSLPEAAGDNSDVRRRLEHLQGELRHIVTRAREIGGVFAHLTDRENMEEVRTFSATRTVEKIVRQVSSIQPGVTFDLSGVASKLRLPPATYAEWVSVFQNAFFNSLNALVDSEERVIRVRSEDREKRRRILIEDTGSGVDLEDSETLFEPFQRRTTISRERQELGFGGSGLGLTIMRLIAGRRSVRVGFESPSSGFATSLVMEWMDKEG